ncbi:hypothetical protein [Bradyrhizobium sp. OK095]|jgi:hypothetical protein|uniref:hypothetical protein n=1 Tax=Bradyrhizobium sp. OK095 TaxID=1882760 RepID=UPI0008B9FA35|nr:hypothetical protein [Bradyrhizobium sp. OK095]SEN02601.1 hypothetical protein SAMN05443254_105333 [Bradyrhizobium sp. OK095]
MQFRLKWLIVITIALVAVVVGEFILDLRAPRSALRQMHAITTTLSVRTADYNAFEAAMEKKYGPKAASILDLHSSRMTTRIDGKLVEDRPAPTWFSDARGFFLVGTEGHASTFPFAIDPAKPPEFGQQGGLGVGFLKTRWGNRLPAKYLDFDDREVVTDTCVTVSSSDFGWPGQLLFIRSGAFCVQFWKGSSPGSMLIGVVVTEGDPWMRPFTRRLCRWLTSKALGRIAATDREVPPDYAACVLVDRPDRPAVSEKLQSYVYEVRRDATLATMN